jgi:hypothetical protein
MFKAQPDDDEVKPRRRLKRMKDLEENVDTEPHLEVVYFSLLPHFIYTLQDSPEVVSTPRKRKRIVTDR